MIQKNTVAALCGLLASGIVACGQSPAAAPLTPPSQGTTRIYAENQVFGTVALERVSVAIDGKHLGGLAGKNVGLGDGDRLPIATTHLREGSHSLTLTARAADRSAAKVLVLNATQPFTVGREPVSVTARLSTHADEHRPRLLVSFSVSGATLDETAGSTLPASCQALTPDNTDICVTEAMLREALAEQDAPRIVCIDERLSRMRRLQRLDEGRTAADGALPHEAEVRKEASFRIAILAREAAHCPSANAASAWTDTRRDGGSDTVR